MSSSPSPPAAPSPYERPLDAARSEIRLLELLSPDDDPGPVRCRLRTVSLADDPPAFCALSYVWGDPRVTTEVLIEHGARPADGSGRGHVVFHATVNLEAALRHVRSRWAAHRDVPADGRSGFLLWADAVCINQADTGERSRQVEMMRRIFSSADLVLAWLGPRDLSLAFGALETIASERESSPVVEDFLGLRWLRSRPDLCEETDTWRQILAFLRLPYWTRIWVFQEMALACELVFVAPGRSIPFRRAWDAAWNMVHVRLSLRESATRGSAAGRRPEWLSRFSWRCLTGDEPAWDDFVYASWAVYGDGDDRAGGVARARGLLLPYLLDYSARHATYASGGTTVMEAFLQLVFHRGEANKGSRRGSELVRRLLCDMTAAATKLVDAREPDMVVLRRAGRLMARLGDEDFAAEAAAITDAAREDVAAEVELGLDGAYALVRHWRLFETRSGYLGIAPGGVRPGDEVCVLRDCYAPVVLRRTGPQSRSGEAPRFTHVGAVVVAGLMDGEAGEFVRDRRATPETLVLV